MATLAQKIRRLRLSKNERVLRDNGILDDSGVHTQDGRNLLWVILFQEYEDKLVAAVGEVQKDDKANESTSK